MLVLSVESARGGAAESAGGGGAGSASVGGGVMGEGSSGEKSASSQSECPSCSEHASWKISSEDVIEKVTGEMRGWSTCSRAQVSA